MSAQTLTEIACVVDQSGSMYKVKEDAIGGFNQFLEEQRGVDGAARLTLTLFNHDHDVICSSEPVADVRPLDDETYRPKGMTALLDAVGVTLEHLDGRLAEADSGGEPDRVLVLILTDGKENASSTYGSREIAEMIQERDARDSWEFVFWGANMDAFEVAESMNIQSENVSQFATTGENVSSVFGQMSRMTRSFRETGDLDELDDFDS